MVASDRTLAAARVLVVGAARSGIAAAGAIRRTHPDVHVRLIDRGALPADLPAGVEAISGDDPSLADGFDLVVKSPGVPGSAPVVAAARARGIPIWSEIELAFRLLGPAHPWIGITGTNGKSTVTSLIGAMLDASDVPAVVAGNIGDAVSGLVGELEGGEWIVCELSSFQLEDVDALHPRVAVLLNVTPDHIDRHGTLEAYAGAKLRMFARQTPDDVAILTDDDPWIHATPDDAIPGEARRVRVRREDAADDLLVGFEGSALGGSHNLENVLTAAAAAEAAGATRPAVLRALRAYRPLAHRMEPVGELAGVRYVNDSKATNQESTIRALTAFSHGVHLILGGSLKGAADYLPLAEAVAAGPVDASYLIGDAARCDRRRARPGRRACDPTRLARRCAHRGRCGGAGGGHRAALAGVRVVRPVPRLRGSRRPVPDARRGARSVNVKGMTKRRRPVSLAEQVLVIATMGLVAFGVIMVYSASSGDVLEMHGNSLFFLEREGAYALAGLIALAICARIDYRLIGKLSPVLIAGSLFLLVVVLGAGVTVNGARRWLPVGAGFTIQPSELAKVALCVFASWTLASRRRAPQTFKETMSPVGIVTLVLILFVMAGSDLGSAICLVLVAAAVLIASGTRALVLVRLAGVAVGGIVLLILIEPYRMERFTTFLDPWSHRQTSGYQIDAVIMAFGHGGLTGVGLGQSGQKFGFLPEAHTDLILAIAGEELGLIGTLAVARRLRGDRVGRLLDRARREGPVRPAARRRHDGARRRPGGAQLRRCARRAAADRRADPVRQLRRHQHDRDARGHRHGALGRRARPGDRRQGGGARPRAPARPHAGAAPAGPRAHAPGRRRRTLTFCSMTAIVIAAGGTAGHVMPALAVAEELTQRGATVSFAGTPGRVEATNVPAAGYPFDGFQVDGLERKPSLKLARALARDAGAPLACARILRRRGADVVLGAGGYVAGPMLAAARVLRIPSVLTEADAHLGLANRLAAPLARRVLLAFPIEGREGDRYRVVGRPVARRFFETGRAEARDALGLPQDAFVLAAFGAFAGAQHVNLTVADTFGDGSLDGIVYHVSGARDLDAVRARVTASEERYRLLASTERFERVLAAADLCVCRAGGSIFELAAWAPRRSSCPTRTRPPTTSA